MLCLLRKSLALLLILWGVAGELLAASVEIPPEVQAAEQQRIEVMKQVASSVVSIFAAGGQGGGTGVLINADGLTVTNFHVVMGQGGFLKCGLNDGKIYDAVLVGIDPTGDVALIQLLGRTDFPFAKIGDSDQVKVGDRVFAMGNPFLLATDFQPTVTYGMVSGTHRYQFPAGTFLEYTDCLQVDASINPGNSGGPLFNLKGEVIGINGRISVEKRGKVNVGAGYAISINQVMNFLDHLKSGRIVDHATLGATVTSLSDGTVVIATILENSEAYRRGLRRDDELVSFSGRPIRSVNQFKNILGIYPKGWTIPLTYRREGQVHEIFVELAGLHRRAELIGDDVPEALPEEQPGPEEKPRPPGIPNPFEKPQPEIPEQYAHLYEERPGYANYAFNKQHQQRLLKELERWGHFNNRPSGWALSGTLTKENESGAFELRLQPEAVVSRWERNGRPEHSLLNLGEDFNAEPLGSGGLLAAMQQLQQLLIDPQAYFTEMYFLGSEPLDGRGERVDVLITTKGLLTSCWYFNQQSGKLIGFDTAIEEDVDPCEIRFSELREFSDFAFPESLTIRHADQEYGQLMIEKVQFYQPGSSAGAAQ